MGEIITQNTPEPADREEDALCRARQLVTELESGNTARAGEIIRDLHGLCENSLHQQIVSLVRELQQSMDGFKLDARIVALTESEMPDARERLNHVIKLTEQAAHRTLGAVEHCFPIVEELTSRAGSMGRLCEALEKDANTSTATRALASEVCELKSSVIRDAETMHAHMSDVLMAQSFQDLTGQIIRRVVDLVQELEDKLSRLVAGAAVLDPEMMADEASPGADPIAAEGPHVPGVDQPGVAQDQDDVDDLLSKLGI